MAEVLHRAVPAEIHSDHGSASRRKKSSSSSKRDRSSPSSTLSSSSKGILKKHPERDEGGVTFEELVEHERPDVTPSSSRHHRHHRSSKSASEHSGSGKRRSKSSRHREESDHVDEVEHRDKATTESSRRRHHKDSEHGEDGSGRRHRHHHRSKHDNDEDEVDQQRVSSSSSKSRHHSSSSGEKKHRHRTSDGGGGGGDTAERRRHHRRKRKEHLDPEDEEVAIYDRPKVPAVPCVANIQDGAPEVEEEHQPQLYENYKYAPDEGCFARGDDDVNQVLYDVPRSSKVVPDEADAIYVNDAYGAEQQQEQYDVPRNASQGGQKSLSELIPEEYDVPKIRDSLSTIEEEHQDYETASNVISEASKTHHHFGGALGYSKMNGHLKGSPPPSASSSSSGYRSSSSPSIHSTDELYVNEVAAMTAAAVVAMQPSTEDPETRDIAVETTLERKKQLDERSNSNHGKQEDFAARERARERERARAEEIEKEIRRRRKEESKHQRTVADYFDNRSNKANSGTLESKGKSSKSNHSDVSKEEVKFVQKEEGSKATKRNTLLKDKDKRRFDFPEISAPKWDVPNDDFVAVGEITGGDCIELKTPADSPTPMTSNNMTELPPPPPPPILEIKVVEKKYTRPASPPPPPPPAPVILPPTPEPKLAKCKPAEKVSKPVSTYTFSCNEEHDTKGRKEEVQTKLGTKDRKKHPMKDRSVDVYHETVRQRVKSKAEAKKAAMTTTLFGQERQDMSGTVKGKKKNGGLEEKRRDDCKRERLPEENQFTNTRSKSKSFSTDSYKKHYDNEDTINSSNAKQANNNSNDIHSSNDDLSNKLTNGSEEQPENDDMPSVRQLRSKFESNYEDEYEEDISTASSPAEQKKKAFKNKVGGGGFLVMSSLTRRSAVTVGKSLKGYFAEMDKAAKKPPKASRIHADVTKLPEDRNPMNGADAGAEIKSHRMPNPGKVEDRPLPSLVDASGKWSPLGFVARLYQLQQLRPDEGDRHSAGAAYAEGWLERLPQGKRKPTAWHPWKKVRLVADAGVLTVSADSESRAAVETLELFGGKAEIIEGSDGEVVLRVTDRRDHSMSLRCPGGKEEGQKWCDFLHVHTQQDFSKTFVVPVPVPANHLSLFTSTLVIDVGGASVRAGVATKIPSLPQLFFPSVMAVERGNDDGKYFGLDCFAEEVRSRSRLSHPMIPDDGVMLDRCSLDQIALQGMLEKVFKELALDPQHYEVQLSVPRALTDRTKQAVASLLFDDFGVRSVNMGHQSVFAFHAYGATSGVMVDLGERMDVVPVVDGYKVQAGVSRSPVGGAHLRSKLRHHLQGRNYSLNSFTDDFVSRLAVEKLAYVAMNFDKELDAFAEDPAKVESSVEVAPEDATDGPAVRHLMLGCERFEACEGLFKPELWGLDQAGVHVLVHKAIRECGVDARREVARSIFLAGGLTLVPGLRERLEAEVTRLTPAPVTPRVHASPYRYHAAYLGAAAHALTEAFGETKISKEEWYESGSALERYWTM